MGEKIFFLVKFDTYDVIYNLSISLLPPIVFDNLFTKPDKLLLYIYRYIY